MLIVAVNHKQQADALSSLREVCFTQRRTSMLARHGCRIPDHACCSCTCTACRLTSTAAESASPSDADCRPGLSSLPRTTAANCCLTAAPWQSCSARSAAAGHPARVRARASSRQALRSSWGACCAAAAAASSSSRALCRGEVGVTLSLDDVAGPAFLRRAAVVVALPRPPARRPPAFGALSAASTPTECAQQATAPS